MLTQNKLLLFFLFHVSALGLLTVEPALSQTVKVRRVIDGDTFHVGVRIIGVDTPETRHPRKPVGFFGKEAAAFLRKLIQGKMVRLELGRDPMDRYGRLLSYVYLPNGVFVNALLVAEGYARASPYRPNLKFADLFRELERKARATRKGIWSRIPVKRGRSGPLRPPVIGNRKTRVYHLPGGLYYDLMLRSKHREDFSSEKDAIRKNYTKSKR
jgi:micrococcal nuclease